MSSLTDLFPPAWMITLYYLLILICIVFGAKVSSVLLEGKRLQSNLCFLVLAPLLSLRSWNRRRDLLGNELFVIVLRGVLMTSLLAIIFIFLPPLTEEFPWWFRSYLAVFPFWLLVETVHIWFQCCWLVPGQFLPAINNRPILSATVAEFWGVRWNRIFGDWLRHVCFQPLARYSNKAVFITLMVSALMHEMLVSIPLWLAYGVNCFGWMLAYFFLQFMAISLERKYLKNYPVLNRLFAWGAVLGPIPLILNKGTLLIFHLAAMP